MFAKYNLKIFSKSSLGISNLTSPNPSFLVKKAGILSSKSNFSFK